MSRAHAVALPNDPRTKEFAVRCLSRICLSAVLAAVLCSPAGAQMCFGRVALGSSRIDNATATIGSGYEGGVTLGDRNFLSAGLHYRSFDGFNEFGEGGESFSNTNMIVSVSRRLETSRTGLHVCPTVAATYLFPVESLGISTSTITLQPGIAVGYELDASPGGLKIVPQASAHFVLLSRTSSDLGGSLGKATEWGGTGGVTLGLGAGVFPSERLSIAPRLEIALSGGGVGFVVDGSFGLGR